MLEKPHISDEDILTCLREDYGLAASRLEFLPWGYDTNAGVYRVDVGERRYFLKVRADAVDELSVSLPRYLAEGGFGHVIPPIPTITGEPWGMAGRFTLLLYPFVEKSEDALSDAQWIAFGEILKRLHGVQLPPDVLARMPRETFIPLPRWPDLVRAVGAAADARAYEDPTQWRVAELWTEQRHEIDLIVERADRLGQMLQGRSSGFVLCHADIHTGNLLVDRDGRLFIVDWDQPVLAPPERDLMFATLGGFVKEPRHEELFFQGYGPVDVDPQVMAYYRYERVMEDIALFAESVFLTDTTAETRQDALKWLRVIFGPAGDVEAAHRLDHVLGM